MIQWNIVDYIPRIVMSISALSSPTELVAVIKYLPLLARVAFIIMSFVL